MAGGKTLEQVIAIAGKLEPSLQQSIGKADKLTSGMGSKLKKTAAITAGAFAAVGTAAAAAAVAGGKYLLDLGTKFDESADTIRIGTGATGDALAALQADCDAVYKAIPGELEGASTAIADFNTRLGLTGEPLQKLSIQANQVCDMLGEDLPTVIESSSQAFQQWGLSEDEMSGKMDYLFKVSQSTGIGFNDLATKMQKYGAQLQELGFDFDHASALMGQLEKAGVNTDEVLGALKKSVTTMAQDGLSASEGIAKYTEEIKNAATAEEAATIAAEVFGSRAGSTLASAIRDGTLSVEDLTAELQANGETISGAAEDTYDFAERLEMFKHTAEVALKPLANTVFDSLNALMPIAAQAIEAFLPVIENVASSAAPVIEQIVSVVSQGLEQMTPMIVEFGAQVGPMLSELVSSLLPPLMDLIMQLLPIIMQIISAVLPVVTTLLSALMPIISSVVSVIGSLLSALMPILDPLLQIVQMLLPPIAGLITGIMAVLQPVIGVIEGIAGVIGTLVGWISQVIDLAGQAASALGGIGDFIGGGIGGLLGFATGGFTNGLAIVGEDPRYPTEAVISFNPAYRAQNLKYWRMAGAMLGAAGGSTVPVYGYAAGGFTGEVGTSLFSSDYGLSGGAVVDSTTYDLSGLTFSPQVNIRGNADAESVLSAVRELEPEFVDLILDAISKREEGAYA